MVDRRSGVVFALLAGSLILSASAVAQPAVPKEAAPSESPVPVLAMSTSIPAGTLVVVRVDQELSSRFSKRGDTFPITLMNDLWLGNRVVVPMGAKGIGEVIHAAGKGFGGRAGELIVTARYLELDGRRIPLIAFKLGLAGADNSTAAMLTTAAVPIAGMFVTGTSATIGVGQLAQAKLAEPVDFSAQSHSTSNEPGTPEKGETK